MHMGRMILMTAMLLGAGCASVADQPPTATTVNEQGYKSIVEEDFAFAWKVNGDNLDCILTGATQGWVAVGFNTQKPKMDKSNFIIGYVADGKVEIEDQMAKGWGHHKDEVQNLMQISGEENEESTILRFTIPLGDDANQEDAVLAEGNIVYLLLAIGGKDDLRSYHKSRDVFKIEL